MYFKNFKIWFLNINFYIIFKNEICDTFLIFKTCKNNLTQEQIQLKKEIVELTKTLNLNEKDSNIKSVNESTKNIASDLKKIDISSLSKAAPLTSIQNIKIESYKSLNLKEDYNEICQSENKTISKFYSGGTSKEKLIFLDTPDESNYIDKPCNQAYYISIEIKWDDLFISYIKNLPYTTNNFSRTNTLEDFKRSSAEIKNDCRNFYSPRNFEASFYDQESKQINIAETSKIKFEKKSSSTWPKYKYPKKIFKCEIKENDVLTFGPFVAEPKYFSLFGGDLIFPIDRMSDGRIIIPWDKFRN